MRWPLRNQILLPMTCLMAATLLVVSLVDAYLAGRQARRQIETRLRSVGETLASANYPLTDAVLRQMSGFSGAHFALVSDDNVLLAASREFELAPWTTPLREENSHHEFGALATLSDGRYFHTTVPLDNARRPTQTGVLHIFYAERSYTEAWRLAVFPPLVVGGVALLLVAISGAMIAARVARPLDRLRDQVHRIAQGNFQAVAVPQRNDEIADLSRAVNEMARMLDRYAENVRRSEQLRTLGKLGGGIAHQIRNSLTGCRMALDLHCRECDTANDESIDMARQQLALMEEYIGRFLALGRTDQQPQEPFDVCDAVRRAVLLVTPMARHAQVELRSTVPAESLTVLGNANDVSQLVVNLLLNAVEATVAGAIKPEVREVRVVVTTSDSQVQIAVYDHGPGPAAEIGEQLFEPLVSNKRDGVGLGLSVAKSVAEHHGGVISWQRVDEQTCFRVKLPLK